MKVAFPFLILSKLNQNNQTGFLYLLHDTQGGNPGLDIVGHGTRGAVSDVLGENYHKSHQLPSRGVWHRSTLLPFFPFLTGSPTCQDRAQDLPLLPGNAETGCQRTKGSCMPSRDIMSRNSFPGFWFHTQHLSNFMSLNITGEIFMTGN